MKGNLVSAPAGHPIFVYGTLMQGQRASHMLLSCRYAGRCILPDFAMYDLGRYPGIQPCTGEQVFGELYYVDAHTLQQMDAYEENGSLYHRTPVTVLLEGKPCPAQAYLYARSVDGKPLMHRPWESQ